MRNLIGTIAWVAGIIVLVLSGAVYASTPAIEEILLPTPPPVVEAPTPPPPPEATPEPTPEATPESTPEPTPTPESTPVPTTPPIIVVIQPSTPPSPPPPPAPECEHPGKAPKQPPGIIKKPECPEGWNPGYVFLWTRQVRARPAWRVIVPASARRVR